MKHLNYPLSWLIIFIRAFGFFFSHAPRNFTVSLSCAIHCYFTLASSIIHWTVKPIIIIKINRNTQRKCTEYLNFLNRPRHTHTVREKERVSKKKNCLIIKSIIGYENVNGALSYDKWTQRLMYLLSGLMFTTFLFRTYNLISVIFGVCVCESEKEFENFNNCPLAEKVYM